MHDFPPSIDDFGFGTTPIGLLLTLCVAMYFAFKVTGSPAVTFAWTVVACCFFTWSMNSRGSEYNVTYATPMWTVVLTATIATVAGVAVFRNILRAEGAQRWNAGLTAVAVGTPILLFALLLPVVSTPRPFASRTHCKNNLKLIGLAMHNYHDVHNTFPLAKAGPPATSWRVNLLPYLDNAELYNR